MKADVKNAGKRARGILAGLGIAARMGRPDVTGRQARLLVAVADIDRADTALQHDPKLAALVVVLADPDENL